MNSTELSYYLPDGEDQQVYGNSFSFGFTFDLSSKTEKTDMMGWIYRVIPSDEIFETFGDGRKKVRKEYEAFYDFLKKIYTEIDYEKIPSKTMNHVYFDGDRSLLSLFKLCHYSSREQWYEWNQIVKNALSLIVLLSLQSMIASTENKKKENILDIVKNYVEMHYAEDITLREICEKHFYNVSYISRKFKKTVGCTFEQYLRQIRIERAGEMLRATDMSVSDIADRCGYTSVRSFRKAFVFVTGKTPIEFKKIYKFSKY